MKCLEAGRRVLLLCSAISAACTDPTFLDPDSEVSANGDAASERDADAAQLEPVQENDSGSVISRDASSPESGVDSKPDGAVAALDAAASAAEGGSPAAEAAVPQDAQADDATQPVTPLPSWAAPLLGRYGKRSINFAYAATGSVTTVTIEVSLLTFAANHAGEIDMTTQLCAFSTYWTDGRAKFVLEKPLSISPFKTRILLGQAPHFSSETSIQQLGFEPARQAPCTSGASRPQKYEDQKWLPGNTCTCAAAPEVLPVSSSDCRLTDPDADAEPGVTLLGSGLARTDSFVLNSTVKIVDAEVRVDREHVMDERRARNVACVSGCFLGDEVLCPEHETVVRPLDTNADCAGALEKVNVIALPTFPSGDCRAPSQ